MINQLTKNKIMGVVYNCATPDKYWDFDFLFLLQGEKTKDIARVMEGKR
jgi:hypothetical protein